MLVLACAGLAAVVAAGGVLAWDGGFYFFLTLQEARPITMHHRVGLWPMTRLLLAGSEFTENVPQLAVLFGSALALVPLLALAASLASLKGDKAWLRIWPVLGILIAPLPSQVCLVAESAMAMQLFWAAWAALAGGTRLWRLAVVAVVATWMFTLHPVAGPLLLLLAGTLVYFWWKMRSRLAALTAAVLAAAGCWRILLLLLEPAYERDQALAEGTWRLAWDNLAGFPLLLSLAMLAQAVALFRPGVWPVRVSLALWLVAVPAGLLWALDPARWAWSLNFRFALFPLTALLALVACAHIRRPGSRSSLALPAIVFATVLCAQALTWHRLVADLRAELQGAPGLLLQPAWTASTPLDHWTLPVLAVVVQGREPSTLVVRDAEDLTGAGVRLTKTETLRLEQGWFRLESLRVQLSRPPGAAMESGDGA